MMKGLELFATLAPGIIALSSVVVAAAAWKAVLLLEQMAKELRHQREEARHLSRNQMESLQETARVLQKAITRAHSDATLAKDLKSRGSRE